MASATVMGLENLNTESSLPEKPSNQCHEPKYYEENSTKATDIPANAADDINGVNERDWRNKDRETEGDSKPHGYSSPEQATTDDTLETGKPILELEDTKRELDENQRPIDNGEPEASASARRNNEPGETRHRHPATGPDTSFQNPDYRFKKLSLPESDEASPSSADAKFAADMLGNSGRMTNGENVLNVSQSVPVNDNEERQRAYKKASEDSNKTLVSGRQAGKRWHYSKVRFAPWNVPLKRRLQTLVVLFHSTCIALSVSLFFFLCAIPIFWPFLIPYLLYCISSNAAASGTLTRRSRWLRGSSIWSLFASYYPARLHRTHELPPTRKYIFGYHPHGIISHGAWAAFATEALGFSQLFPGITNTLLTLESNFRVPIYREYILAMGLASVSRESCENLLSKGGMNGEGMGRAITIVIGGAAESLDAQPYTMKLILKRRKGFIRMALRTGADLVPVMAFGENDLYDQYSSDSHPLIHKAQLLLKKLLGFTIPLFHARGVFNYDVGLMPYRRPLNIVVGRPIKVAQSAKPSQDEIDRLHEEYIDELQKLWDRWKDDFAADRKEELQICE